MKAFLKQLADIFIEHLRRTTSSRFKLSLYVIFLGFILALYNRLTGEFVALVSAVSAFYNIAKSYTDVKNGSKPNGNP